MKLYLLLLLMIFSTATCSARTSLIANPNSNTDADAESFTLKKNESREIGNFKIKMLSVGHTIGKQGHSVYVDLEILHHEEVSKQTIYLSKEILIGNKWLRLIAINEKADPKLSDPFASTSCTLLVSDGPTEKAEINKDNLTEYCYRNGGLKSQITISFAVDGSSVTDGEFEVISNEGDTSGEIYHFNGTKTGNALTVKFTGTVPEGFDKIKKLVWTLGKTNLKAQMFGKNYNTNKWGVYTATYDKCKL